MNKIKEILIGTNNIGKYKEICALLPKKVRKYSLKKFKLTSPEENGKNYEENAYIKASYYSKETNLICLADDSGLEIDLLDGNPGIYSSRWGGDKKSFDLAIDKVFQEMNKKKPDWKKKDAKAKFICCLTVCWPKGNIYTSKGIINGHISSTKKGYKGFGYDPIFIPKGYNKTFAEMKPKFKMSIDHRSVAFSKMKNIF